MRRVGFVDSGALWKITVLLAADLLMLYLLTKK